jgi:hypothetical protein
MPECRLGIHEKLQHFAIVIYKDAGYGYLWWGIILIIPGMKEIISIF